MFINDLDRCGGEIDLGEVFAVFTRQRPKKVGFTWEREASKSR